MNFVNRKDTISSEPRIFNYGEYGSNIRPPSLNSIQNFEAIRDNCLKDSHLFEDKEFDAVASSISSTKKHQVFKWLRPFEIVKNPYFIKSEKSKFSAKHSIYDNPWLIAGFTCLLSNEKLFEFVVPKDNNCSGQNYRGLNRFRFWQFGRWIEVVIDDRLPVKKDGNILGIQTLNEDEFWVQLMEKAYAK